VTASGLLITRSEFFFYVASVLALSPNPEPSSSSQPVFALCFRGVLLRSVRQSLLDCPVINGASRFDMC